ncbi:MAG: hypothetical protein QUS09_04385 [Methanotrichaceae archaeon]|nr:hypothetical protein [Methanotrichaceae archaeon]
MKDFDAYMSAIQTQWRKDHVRNREEGKHNGKRRPWILPKHLWEEGLWSGIRESLPAYLESSGVQKHDGVHNLKSSWMQCANLYFPFREDLHMIETFLREAVSAQIATVERIELEWAEQPPLDPTTLLGEPQGQRGKNQTSPDIAFLVALKDGCRGIILTENKLTEHSFYGCSGHDKDLNPDPRRCMNFQSVWSDTKHQCHQLHWAEGDRTNRKYWDYLKFSPMAFETLKRCPAATAGYQLFRQQALAEALAQKGPYAFVASCVAYDVRNQSLIECLRGTGIKDFTSCWGPLFEGRARFTTFTHQQWVTWVRDHDTAGRWDKWSDYVETRYALGPNPSG